MGRPRKPTEVLEVQGAFSRNPSRKRKHEPKGGAALTLADLPPHLAKKKLVMTCWIELLTRAPRGVIKAADAISLEVTAELLAEFRSKPTDMKAAKLSRLEAMLGKFGMTPSDRAKLNLGGDDDDKKEIDLWGDFKGQSGRA